MKIIFSGFVTIVIMLFCAMSAQATITCTNPTSTGFSTAYLSTGVVPNMTQGGNVTFTCSRSAAGDATTVYLRADNGINTCAGATNDAVFGGKCISYEAYQNSSCTTLWTGNSGATSIPVTLNNVVGNTNLTISWWGCITVAGQAPTAGAGTYTDTVTMTIRANNGGGGTTYATGTFPVSVTYPATCTITSVDPVAFGTYVAFRNSVLTAPTSNVIMNCTSKLPYTLSLDATSGVIVGLNYSLALSAVGTQRGAGPGQTFTLIGTMPANQAGTCSTGSCGSTNVHTLTVTY